MSKFSGNKIKNAGKKLILDINDVDSLKILSYWRTDHLVPLETAFSLLEKYAKKLDEKALLGKRLKRTPSIVNKLRILENNLQLTTMNDIGGCRVILNSEKKVRKLSRTLSQKTSFVLRNDYINTPRDSGYRGLHLVGKFLNKNKEQRKIELQIRTKIQHAWATAIEIVDIFTNQSIKSNQGEINWALFFKHVGEQFALFDKNPYLNVAVPKDKTDIRFVKHYIGQFNSLYKNADFKKNVTTIANLSNTLSIVEKFQMFAKSLEITSEHIARNGSDGYYLISIDFDKKETYTINLKQFEKKDIKIATEEYLELEKKSFLENSFITALISTSDVGEIKDAYPNYFADSTKFIELLLIILETEKRTSSTFSKLSNVINKSILGMFPSRTRFIKSKL